MGEKLKEEIKEWVTSLPCLFLLKMRRLCRHTACTPCCMEYSVHRRVWIMPLLLAFSTLFRPVTVANCRGCYLRTAQLRDFDLGSETPA